MNDTRRLTRNKRRLRLGPAPCAFAAATAVLSVNMAKAFCPLSSNHVHQVPLQTVSAPHHFRRPWLALSSNSNNENDSGEETSNILLHQEIHKLDPDWYQEYVSDLLGEEYCNDRWLAMDVPASEKVQEASESDDAIVATGEELEESSIDENENDTVEETSESDDTIVGTGEELEESSIDESVNDTIPEEEVETVDTNEILAKEEEIGDDENKAEAKEQTNGDQPIVDNETRALVYRSITGKKMTCVPLAEILDLGYSVSDLERIQAEFLSIVVLDQRKCPSMGVPSQWKIKDPKAKPEVTFLDSMEEAEIMVNEMNEQERVEKESIQQRRKRQEDRQTEPAETDRSVNRTSRRGNRDERNPRSKKRANKEKPSSPRQTSRDRERKRRRRENDSPPNRRRRERLDRDGNPRKIYRVPRDDTRSRTSKVDDPPDPESPVWVNMDQFRDLLQKEAEFRMKFIGEDWSEVIEQENDWREELYKGWLWNLKNGIGESFVPPSRYERARRTQQKLQSSAPPRRSSKDTPRRRTLDERRRRGKRSQPPQEQRKRRKRNPEKAEEDSDDAPSTAAERRSRRERRRGPPENDR